MKKFILILTLILFLLAPNALAFPPWVPSTSGADTNTQLTEGVTLQTFGDEDATPDVTNGTTSVHTLWQVHGSSSPTITDFDDGNDHSEFSDGDWFILIVNFTPVIDFSDNANIEGNSNTDFTGSASQIIVIKFMYEGTQWKAQGFDSGLSDPTTQAVKVARETVTDADGFTMTAAQGFGATIYATGAGVIVMPAVADGMEFSLECHTAGNADLNPDATGTEDTIILDGTSLAQGDAIRCSGLGGLAVCTYYAADTWSCITDGFTDVN